MSTRSILSASVLAGPEAKARCAGYEDDAPILVLEEPGFHVTVASRDRWHITCPMSRSPSPWRAKRRSSPARRRDITPTTTQARAHAPSAKRVRSQMQPRAHQRAGRGGREFAPSGRPLTLPSSAQAGKKLKAYATAFAQ